MRRPEAWFAATSPGGPRKLAHRRAGGRAPSLNAAASPPCTPPLPALYQAFQTLLCLAAADPFGATLPRHRETRKGPGGILRPAGFDALSRDQEGKLQMASGTVKFFNDQKGFGFITPDDGSQGCVRAHLGGRKGRPPLVRRGHEGQLRRRVGARQGRRLQSRQRVNLALSASSAGSGARSSGPGFLWAPAAPPSIRHGRTYALHVLSRAAGIGPEAVRRHLNEEDASATARDSAPPLSRGERECASHEGRRGAPGHRGQKILSPPPHPLLSSSHSRSFRGVLRRRSSGGAGMRRPEAWFAATCRAVPANSSTGPVRPGAARRVKGATPSRFPSGRS